MDEGHIVKEHEKMRFREPLVLSFKFEFGQSFCT